jgi:hypothetical protein
MFEGNGAVDEYTLTQELGKDAAQSKLQNHWDTWITQADFNQMAGAGLNHVRIPIGYWSVIPIDGEPFVQGAYDKLGQALDWASGAGLKVMIDLHGGKCRPHSCSAFLAGLTYLSTSIAERIRQLWQVWQYWLDTGRHGGPHHQCSEQDS